MDSKIEVPALGKALEIIELLSFSNDGMTLNEVTARLRRTMGEIYRIAVFLSKRGYLSHDVESGRYALTPKLLEIANRHPPTDKMVKLAVPLMAKLSELTEQSCHFAVLFHENVIIIASSTSSRPASYSVKTGAVFPISTTSSGLVITAHLPAEIRSRYLSDLSEADSHTASRRIERIRKLGHERVKSSLVDGILNLSVPVFDYNGIVGAITTGYIRHLGQSMQPDEVLVAMKETCRQLSRQLGAPIAI